MSGIDLARNAAIVKAINGALLSTIDAHGPITEVNCHSAAKRIYGALRCYAKQQGRKARVRDA